MPLNFELVEVNPNDTTGGGGSLAGPMHDADSEGPYFVWPNQEYESHISPHAVVSATEVRLMAQALKQYESGNLEALAGGEREAYAPERSSLEYQGVEQEESPVFDMDATGGPQAFLKAIAADRE